MARCPKCRHQFRTMEDEEGQHDCPRCGYGPEDRESTKVPLVTRPALKEESK